MPDWSLKSKWPQVKLYQAWSKWTTITERIEVYAKALATVLGGDTQAADIMAVELLHQECEKKRTPPDPNVPLSKPECASFTEFRRDFLTKQLTSEYKARFLQDPSALGMELLARLPRPSSASASGGS